MPFDRGKAGATLILSSPEREQDDVFYQVCKRGSESANLDEREIVGDENRRISLSHDSDSGLLNETRRGLQG
jgi:hypothetical protein